VISYAFMNWFRWYMSTRYHPVDYEWGRIAKMTTLAFAMYALIVAMPIENAYVSFVARFAVAATFPFALALTGFYEPRERARIAELVVEGRARAVRFVRRKPSEPAR
jgi:hypothetical protein